MTKEELKNMLFIIDTLLDDAITDSTRQKVKDTLTDVCKLAIKALEQQSCEDCISREEAINEANNISLETSYDNEKVEQMLRDLPSVTPERPKGKWIKDTQTGFKIRCSECGARNFGADRAYCPRCGRQMKEDNDD